MKVGLGLSPLPMSTSTKSSADVNPYPNFPSSANLSIKTPHQNRLFGSVESRNQQLWGNLSPKPLSICTWFTHKYLILPMQWCMKNPQEQLQFYLLITKKVVSKVLLPMVNSTHTTPLAGDTLPSKSFSCRSVLVKSWSPFPSFRYITYGIILIATPPSISILETGYPSTLPLTNKALRCCLSSSEGFSKIVVIGSSANRAIWSRRLISSSSLEGARNSIGNMNTMLTSADGPFPCGPTAANLQT